MSQSVKLSDGSYIDAGAVWDNTLGKSQEDINNNTMWWGGTGLKQFVPTGGKAYSYDTDNAITLPKGLYLIGGRFQIKTPYYHTCYIVKPDESGYPSLTWQAVAIIDVPADKTDWQDKQVMFPVTIPDGGTRICFGCYCEAPTTSTTAVEYEIVWLKLHD